MMELFLSVYGEVLATCAVLLTSLTVFQKRRIAAHIADVNIERETK